MSEQEHQPSEERREREPTVPRIYVASLSDYNAGRLHGSWLEAAQDGEALLAGISEMLAASPEPIAEEWAIHDYEGFGSVRLSEYENVETVSRLALGIEEHGPAFAAWAGSMGTEESLLERFEDCYLGQWESTAAYAEDLVADLGLDEALEKVVPDGLQPYVRVDTEGLGRDMELSGDLTAVDDGQGGVFLFSQ